MRHKISWNCRYWNCSVICSHSTSFVLYAVFEIFILWQTISTPKFSYFMCIYNKKRGCEFIFSVFRPWKMNSLIFQLLMLKNMNIMRWLFSKCLFFSSWFYTWFETLWCSKRFLWFSFPKLTVEYRMPRMNSFSQCNEYATKRNSHQLWFSWFLGSSIMH